MLNNYMENNFSQHRLYVCSILFMVRLRFVHFHNSHIFSKLWQHINWEHI